MQSIKDHFGQSQSLSECICGKLIAQPLIIANGNVPICSLKCYKDYNEVMSCVAVLQEKEVGDLLQDLADLLEERDELLGNNGEKIREYPEDDPRADR